MATVVGLRRGRGMRWVGLLVTVFGCGDRHLVAILPADQRAAPEQECAQGEGHGAGPLPPMGWNGWNTFGCGPELDQAKIRANADALIERGLRAIGYQYVNLDACWQEGRDSSGVVLANATRFPDGIEALGSYVHQRGLKLGINSSIGDCPVPELTPPGSQGYEAQDATLYAGFGVDYLKYNGCGSQGGTLQASFETMRDALIQSGRPMLLSIVDVPFKYWHSQVGQLWRTHGDVTPSWQGILDIIDATTPLAAYAGQGGYNDSDMLWIGNPGLNEAESQATFSMWSILASPLIAGNDLSTMSEATRAILTRAEVLALNQDALRLQGVLLGGQGDVMVYAKPLAQCGARGVVLLNRGAEPALGSVSWRELGLTGGPALVRDLWTSSTSTSIDGFSATVSPHTALALRVVGTEPPLPRGQVYLSDLSWTYAANGRGPVVRDRELGDVEAGDGGPLRLGGRTYQKGLAVSSPSLVRYRLGKRCHDLSAEIGIDDATGGGSAVFQVWADGEKLFDSGIIYGDMMPQSLSVDVSGRSEVRLWVGQVDDIDQDHADWADARLRCDD
ncbi:MAG: NPCBM/NEW2 domain-containing protein [Deltaproteobacteria bacterium]